MRVSLIGGTGAVGALLQRHLEAAGADVSVWGRSSGGRLDVTQPIEDDRPVDSDCTVYLAWATGDRSTSAQLAHAAAAERWARAAARSGSRFLFISTVLAHDESRSAYGRHKLIAEQRVSALGARNLRVGLVIDDEYSGLLATRLRRMVERLPAVRSIAAWPVHPVSGSDVAAACLAEAMTDDESDIPVWLAPEAAIPLAEVLVPDSDARVFSRFARIIDIGAGLIPPLPGPIGRYGDALRGLAPVPFDPIGTRPPANGRIAPDGWRDGITTSPR